MMIYSLLQNPTSKRRKAQHEFPVLDEENVDYIPETPSCSPCLPEEMHPLTALIEQLFEEGVAHDCQWTFPTKQLIPPHEREYVLQVLKERFGPSQNLFSQLPCEEPDSLRNAFYSCRDNWFYQLFDKEGYDPDIACASLTAWLKGNINTLVLCGDKLSNAKLLFNVLTGSFPLAISDAHINSMTTLANIAPQTPLYCLPFVDEKPNPLMLHYMEGNRLNCMVDGKMQHIPATSILIHCLDVSLAHTFACRNTVILFLTGEHRNTPTCHSARKELRDLALNSTAANCIMNLHCKRDNELCHICINNTHSAND